MEFGWKVRVGLVLGATCFCLALLLVDQYWRLPHFGLFLLPLGIVWGVCWIFAGWRFDLRTAVAICAILVLGWCAANWQFERAGIDSGEPVVDYWFGGWAVIGLGFYCLVRWISGRQPAVCGMLAALVIACGVNFNAYAAASSKHALTHSSGGPLSSAGLPA